MKLKSWLALAIAVAASVPASASDLNYGYGGGMKDGPAGVPIPAPVPVYETFRWYLRADIGGGFMSAPSVKEQGILYGGTDSKAPFGASSSWFTADFDTFFTGGVGAGLYLTPRLRSDITFDWRTKSEVNGSGTFSYNQYAGVPFADTGRTVRGTMVEHTEVHGTVGLVNLYYDLIDRGSFTPYIGIGAGFAVRNVDRHHSTTESLFDPVSGTTTPYATISAHGKSSRIVPAAAATAGFSYAVSPGVLVDLNYRLTYIGAAESSTVINSQTSKLAIGDTLEHALRAGLRWNVW